jgi:hypothetical protein
MRQTIGKPALEGERAPWRVRLRLDRRTHSRGGEERRRRPVFYARLVPRRPLSMLSRMVGLERYGMGTRSACPDRSGTILDCNKLVNLVLTPRATGNPSDGAGFFCAAINQPPRLSVGFCRACRSGNQGVGNQSDILDLNRYPAQYEARFLLVLPGRRATASPQCTHPGRP